MAAKRATSYAERLRLGIAVIHGEVKEEEEDIDGRNSPPNEDESFSDRYSISNYLIIHIELTYHLQI